jgi:hypothetical protein
MPAQRFVENHAAPLSRIIHPGDTPSADIGKAFDAYSKK